MLSDGRGPWPSCSEVSEECLVELTIFAPPLTRYFGSLLARYSSKLKSHDLTTG